MDINKFLSSNIEELLTKKIEFKLYVLSESNLNIFDSFIFISFVIGLIFNIILYALKKIDKENIQINIFKNCFWSSFGIFIINIMKHIDMPILELSGTNAIIFSICSIYIALIEMFCLLDIIIKNIFIPFEFFIVQEKMYFNSFKLFIKLLLFVLILLALSNIENVIFVFCIICCYSFIKNKLSDYLNQYLNKNINTSTK